MIDRSFTPIEGDGTFFLRPGDARTDDVQSGGDGHDVVVRTEGSGRTSLGEQWVLWVVVGCEEEFTVGTPGGEVVGLIRFDESDAGAHGEQRAVNHRAKTPF